MKELLIVISLIVIGTSFVAAYNDWEEPHASRELRLAGLSNDLIISDQPTVVVALRGTRDELHSEPAACLPR